MSDDDDQHNAHERRVLPRVFNGQRARSALAALSHPAATPQLVFDASGTTQVDAYAGAVLGLALRAHLARSDDNRVVVIEPATDAAWTLMHDLIGGPMLAGRCSWAQTRSTPPRGRDVILPASAIVDDEDIELIAVEALPRAAGALGFGARDARLLQEAAVALLDNAVGHGGTQLAAPVICAALDQQSNDLGLVVANLDDLAPDEGEAALRDAVARSRLSAGGIQSLVEPERGSLELSVRLAYGNGRAHYRTGRSWHFSSNNAHIPCFLAGVEIHR